MKRSRIILEYDRTKVETALRDSLEELTTRDLLLLQINVHERTLSHRLAIYLQKRFDGWDVDCEYNRQHGDGDPKILDDVHSRMLRELRSQPDILDDEAVTVFPDIIVHRRNTRQNLLVLEVKKSPTRQQDRELDWVKLKGYVESQHLQYAHGALVTIPVGKAAGEQARVDWYPPT